MAEDNSGDKESLLSRAGTLLSVIGAYYLVELVLVIVVFAVAELQLTFFTDDAGVGYKFTRYEFIMMLMMLLLLFIASANMLNTARARVSAAELLELQSGGNDGEG